MLPPIKPTKEMVRGRSDGENGAGERKGKELTGSGGVLTGMEREGEALGGLKRGRSLVGARRGAPRERGRPLWRHRSGFVVKKVSSGGYGDSGSKRRLEAVFLNRAPSEASVLTAQVQNLPGKDKACAPCSGRLARGPGTTGKVKATQV